MNRYFLHLAYNGKAYHGWQIQPGAVSVQEVLEKCISLKLKQTVSVTGCGRTDTGVNARNFYAHFECEPIDDLQNFVYQLNVFLPDDIVVFDCWQVYHHFHARFDATSRTYHYYITRSKNPFHSHDSFYVYGNLDVEMMNEAAAILFEYTDFTSFSKLHTQVKTNNCKIMEARWYCEGDLLVFEIKADRFLRNMVRAIVGTMLEVGKGKMDLDGFRAVIEHKDRCSAGTSVPAHALFLENVSYPTELFKGVD
ncbi:MAG: tRNA pseudouridine(38-40) synthase TruA [Bacteroidales bacterium]|nr:tRNA pseudouridine(38-40) synthase TruA [Bacteroidales bacterium]